MGFNSGFKGLNRPISKLLYGMEVLMSSSTGYELDNRGSIRVKEELFFMPLLSDRSCSSAITLLRRALSLRREGAGFLKE